MIYPRIFSRIKTKQGQTHCSYKSFLYFLPDIFFLFSKLNFFFSSASKTKIELTLNCACCCLPVFWFVQSLNYKTLKIIFLFTMTKTSIIITLYFILCDFFPVSTNHPQKVTIFPPPKNFHASFTNRIKISTYTSVSLLLSCNYKSHGPFFFTNSLKFKKTKNFFSSCLFVCWF
jgi:hypothetical protein